MEKLSEKVGLFGAIRNLFRYHSTFSGRSSRSEYWYLWLAGLIIQVLYTVTALFGESLVDLADYPIPFLVVSVIFFLVLAALVVPNLSIMSRRLRDGGISPYFLFFLLLPVLGWLALFVMMMFPSKPTTT